MNDMNTTAKPTPGPYTAEPNEENKPYFDVYKGAVKICSECGGGDARLIADSLNVYHETGLTPRQLADEVMDLGRRIAETQAELSRIYAARDALADQRAELLAALESLPCALTDAYELCGDQDCNRCRAIARAKAVPK